MIDLSFKERLKKFTESLPKQVKSEFNEYYLNARWNSALKYSNENLNSAPFWLKLPIIISANYKKQGSSFLNDILWAQLCAFLNVRIIDDLIDLDTVALDLTLIAALFQLESEKVLFKQCGCESSFWNLYYSLWTETITAMQNKQIIERSLKPSPKRIIDCHGRESSILNIGTASVCWKYNLKDLFFFVKKLTYNLVAAAQIIDDLSDMENDLKNGLRNYAVAKLFNKNKLNKLSNEKLIEISAKSERKSDKFRLILNDAEKYIKRARFWVEQIDSMKIIENVQELDDEIKFLEKQLAEDNISTVLWAVYN